MIIGITGTLGAGKGMLALHLEGKGFRHVSVSEFLAEKAIARKVPPTRVARRIIGNEYGAHGPTALIEAVLASVKDQGGDIVVESLHTVPEVRYVQGLGGKVVSVDAPLLLRWERIKLERSVKDSGSYEEFVAEQDRQMASDDPNENNLAAAVRAADLHIENLGTPEELFRQVDAILDGI